MNHKETGEPRRYRGVVESPGEIRLDRYAAECLGLLSRSQIKARVVEARVNGRTARLSRPLRAGDVLELRWLPEAPVFLEPENLPLSIIYEDRRCVAVNKAQGMVVHPGAGNPSGTLANALLWRRLYIHGENGPDGSGGPGESGPGESGGPPEYPRYAPRTGIVHRLDRDTSGVIAAAYDDGALAFLSAQFKNRTARKRYLALVRGTPPENAGTIHTRLGRSPRNRKLFSVLPPGGRDGKTALTGYRVLKTWGDYSLLLLLPRTGRTHQIRVHLRFLGCPVLGDPLYGKTDPRFPAATLMLHASGLSLVLPNGNALPLPPDCSGSPVCFRAPAPDRFKAIIRALNKGR
ncbi:MAG: RluA family pseudouridine synthase [Treponema sp.]|jgi:23S rRNA pseudouridine1911/1915/1917 synthase|nr:RluA family pseudouridine synthase [Treponema sp.]